MQKELRDKIRHAVEASGIEKPDLIELLHLVDKHYGKMEETITRSREATTTGRAAFPDVASQVIDALDAYAAFIPQYREALGCRG